MPDLVVMEALGPSCFHYTFTGFPFAPPGIEPRTRMYFPGNRVTVNAAYAATMASSTPGLWRNVVDYNVAPFPPPGWPAAGSIPQSTDPPPQAPEVPAQQPAE